MMKHSGSSLKQPIQLVSERLRQGGHKLRRLLLELKNSSIYATKEDHKDPYTYRDCSRFSNACKRARPVGAPSTYRQTNESRGYADTAQPYRA